MVEEKPGAGSELNQDGQGRGKVQGKGRGEKGKEEGQGRGKGRGQSQEPKKWQDPTFKAKIQCKFCHKIGHYESDCWTKQKVERQARSLAKKGQDKGKSSGTKAGEISGDEAPNRKRKLEKLTYMQQTDTMALDVEVQGRRLTGIIDTGATLSVISSKLVNQRDINPEGAVPIPVGNGEVICSLGF